MKPPEFPIARENKLYLLMSGVTAGVICHFINNHVTPIVLLVIFGWLTTVMYRYLVSRDLERALRKIDDPTQRWSRYRLLGLSTRMASYYLINFPKIPDTPKPIVDAVEDADLVLLANVQYFCLGLGVAYCGLIYALKTTS